MLVQTYLGGTYVTIMIAAIWPSCKHPGDFYTESERRSIDNLLDNKIPNHLPKSAGIDSKGLLSVFLFWCIQVGECQKRANKANFANGSFRLLSF